MWAFLVTQSVKNLPAVQETQVQSLGQKDLLEKEMATYSSVLAWKIPWTEVFSLRIGESMYRRGLSQRIVVTILKHLSHHDSFNVLFLGLDFFSISIMEFYFSPQVNTVPITP